MLRRLLVVLVLPCSLALFGCDNDYPEGGAWEDTEREIEVEVEEDVFEDEGVQVDPYAPEPDAQLDENVLEDDGVEVYENEEIIREDPNAPAPQTAPEGQMTPQEQAPAERPIAPEEQRPLGEQRPLNEPDELEFELEQGLDPGPTGD